MTYLRVSDSPWSAVADMAESPVFIGGYPRSGTTLLTSLLDSHSELLVYPRETQFFRLVWPLLQRQPARALDFLVWETGRLPWYTTELYEGSAALGQYSDTLLKLFAHSDGSPRALLQAIIMAHGIVIGQQQKHWWIEKTPHNERYVRLIARWFPRARMLYMLRDPRATFASIRGWQKALDHAPIHTVRFCAEWAASLAYAHRCKRYLPTLLLRYEDLVSDPQSTLMRLCDFLEVPFQEAMLQPTFGGAEFAGFSSYTMRDTRFTTIDPSSLDRWRSKIDQPHIMQIDYLLSQPMAAQGYACDARQPLSSWQAFAWLLRYMLPYQAAARLLQAPAPVQQLARRLARVRVPNALDEYEQARAQAAPVRGDS
jgi:hypothetical protein